MADKSPPDSSEVRAALAALCAVMVKTFDEESPGFQSKFKMNLDSLNRQIKEYTGPETVETLRWVREMLKV